MTRDETLGILKDVQTKLTQECCGTLLDRDAAADRLTEVIQALSYNPGKQRIVCAANKFPDGTLILGARHWDPMMRKTYNALGLTRDESGREVQGFIDQYQNFLTREEAWPIALAAGQIVRRCGGDEGCLYSENLY